MREGSSSVLSHVKHSFPELCVEETLFPGFLEFCLLAYFGFLPLTEPFYIRLQEKLSCQHF